MQLDNETMNNDLVTWTKMNPQKKNQNKVVENHKTHN
jgi:hypothetical protein